MEPELLPEVALESSTVVANCRMNRERGIIGKNSYTADLFLNPLEFLGERIPLNAEMVKTNSRFRHRHGRGIESNRNSANRTALGLVLPSQGRLSCRLRYKVVFEKELVSISAVFFQNAERNRTSAHRKSLPRARKKIRTSSRHGRLS